MIWGCFNVNGVGEIRICEGTMNQTKYLETLNTTLMPSIKKYKLENVCFYLNDSARPHRTKKITEWHQINNVNKIAWPGNSPDLNLIENLWGIIKKKLNRLESSNKQKIIENIKRIWYGGLDEATIQNLAISIPDNIQQSLKNKGTNRVFKTGSPDQNVGSREENFNKMSGVGSKFGKNREKMIFTNFH